MLQGARHVMTSDASNVIWYWLRNSSEVQKNDRNNMEDAFNVKTDTSWENWIFNKHLIYSGAFEWPGNIASEGHMLQYVISMSN